MDEWTQVLQLRWYHWVPIDLYESLIGVLMGLFALASGAVAVGGLIGIIPKETVPALKWYQVILGLGAVACLAWVALRATWTSIIDLVRPALTYQGRLNQLEREHVKGQLGGHYIWTLSSDEKQWSIPCTDVTDTFKQQLIIGRQFRLQYRQGTGWVTHLWIESR